MDASETVERPLGRNATLPLKATTLPFLMGNKDAESFIAGALWFARAATFLPQGVLLNLIVTISDSLKLGATASPLVEPMASAVREHSVHDDGRRRICPSCSSNFKPGRGALRNAHNHGNLVRKCIACSELRKDAETPRHADEKAVSEKPAIPAACESALDPQRTEGDVLI